MIHLLLELEPALRVMKTLRPAFGKQRQHIQRAEVQLSPRRNPHIRDEAETVLESIGGVRVGSGVWSYWRFLTMTRCR